MKLAGVGSGVIMLEIRQDSKIEYRQDTYPAWRYTKFRQNDQLGINLIHIVRPRD